MAEMVWITNGGAPEKGALAFPLDSSSKRLILDGIARYFALDPSSLTVGRVVLLKDANGFSVMDIDQIRQVSTSAGLGDGISEQTPLVITGTSAASASGVTRAFDTVLTSLHQAFNKKRKGPKVDLDRHHELSVIRSKAQYNEFYEGNGIFAYSVELGRSMPQPKFVGEKVSKFIGSLHIVTRKKSGAPGQQEIPRFEDLADKERRGIVTLVKPNGVCLTAEECIEHEQGGDDEEIVIIVKFPRLGPSSYYECKVAARENAVAVLEPVQSQSFDACMAARLGSVGRVAQVLSFSSYTTLDVVPALTLEYIKGNNTKPEVIILPGAALMELGAPVFNVLGVLRGVVVLVDGGKLPKQPRAKRKLRSLHGVEMEVQCVRDLDEDLNDRKVWHKTHKIQLGCSETSYEFMSKAISHNQLVEYTFPVNFKTPIDEWEEKHPLESFSSALPSGGTSKRPRPRPICPRKKLTREQLDALMVEIL